MDLNPVALLPSACIPLRPYTDLRVQEKMYGDAEETLSDSTITSELMNLEISGSGSVGVCGAINSKFVLSITSETMKDPL
jgi:hypothetical protein